MSTASDTDTLLDAAIARHEARDLDSAECCYRDILRIHPDHAEALNLLGLLLQDRGKAGDSIPLISQALEIEPDFPEALANLARGLNLLGDHGAAMAACERAVALDPDLAEAWQQLGYSYLALDRDQDALAALRKAITGITGDIELHTAAGTIAQRLNDHATAVRAWRSVLREQPDRIDALVNLGASLIHLDQTDEAVRLHRRAVELAPDDATAQGALAVTLSKRFEGPELVSLCEAMLARDPERVEILLLLGIGLVWLGRFKEAKAAYQKALDLRPDYHDARWQLAAMAIDAVPPEEMEAFRTRFNDVSFPVMERIASGFMIAKSLERAGDYDAAFQAFLDANALGYADLKANNKDFDLRKLQTYVDWVRGVFTKTGFGELRQWGNPSELPVFIVGMPRSGTSLVEQIASSHPRVFGAGEREDMLALVARVNRGRKGVPPIHWDKVGIRQETARHIAMLKTLAADADRVIDKLPDNIQLLGQIFVLFPNARVIICRRDLRDVCVSCFTTHFGDNIDWSYDLEDCARRALEIERLVDHWRKVLPDRVLEVSYETLVANLEAESRRLIAFLGLEWDPACLDFHKNKRQVTTASILQVRQPLYDTSIGRWRRYERHLGPMLEILSEGTPRRPETQAASTTPDVAEDGPVRRGIALLAAGKHREAVKLLEDGVSLYPNDHDALANLGIALSEVGDFARAIEVWRRAVALRPDHGLTHANLGHALTEAGHHAEAIQAQRQAVALAPDEPDFQRTLAAALWRAGDVAGARDAYANALAMAPEYVLCAVSLGRCEAMLGHFAAASECYRQALKVSPDIAEARSGLISINEMQTEAELAGLQNILDDDQMPDADRVWAGFGLGQALDRAGDYDAAFASFRAANILARDQNARGGRIYQRAEFARHVDRLISMFPASVSSRNALGDPSELPVFIVGLPRSGTTLVEQILASHSQVFGAGERADIIRIIMTLGNGNVHQPPLAWDPASLKAQATAEVERLRALGGRARRVINKLPSNIQWLGHIAALLPRARVIVCRRDLRDQGLSCYATNFSSALPWTNDLTDIAAHASQIQRLIAHWRTALPNPLMEIQYEDLVSDPEQQIRRLVGFLGLDWDPACLQFHTTPRIVTSPAMWQVRQPLYTRSVGRWRAYQRSLEPLLDGLNGLIPAVHA